MPDNSMSCCGYRHTDFGWLVELAPPIVDLFSRRGCFLSNFRICLVWFRVFCPPRIEIGRLYRRFVGWFPFPLDRRCRWPNDMRRAGPEGYISLCRLQPREVVPKTSVEV